MPLACLGLGSNLGDRAAYLQGAREALAILPESRLVAFSCIYETPPVGPVEQGPYLNAAAVIETNLAPHDLLAHLRAIERAAGRERHERWGPRTLDLDILLYEDRVIAADDLTVPHPHLHERWFALKPLAEIAPQMVHPTLGATIAELLNRVESSM
ncbi:MAG: 2-amino-4-hydroxy-6-hydroxymethyldihydropteridine diphosphokinase [Planctomycetes bacterium]|nr:2-amino-4-hydroxy-6-hydroxymethyldihydropteridine diphosphokinase [Planctomycetota bacterium]